MRVEYRVFYYRLLYKRATITKQGLYWWFSWRDIGGGQFDERIYEFEQYITLGRG